MNSISVQPRQSFSLLSRRDLALSIVNDVVNYIAQVAFTTDELMVDLHKTLVLEEKPCPPP